jgi:hypothetical protein
MCEPSHSIVQYPAFDPETQDPIKDLVKTAVATAQSLEIADAPTPEKADAIKSSLILPQGVVIDRFINYSRLGSGHSEAIGKLSPRIRCRLPEDVKYEAHWWERSVKLDGRKPGWVNDYGPEESLSSATVYANRSSIGDMKIFRRFFENSLRHTDRPSSYVEPFLQMINGKGRDYLARSIKRFYSGKTYSLDMTIISALGGPQKERMIGLLLKTTRVREYLNDAWADGELWLPKPKPLLILGGVP